MAGFKSLGLKQCATVLLAAAFLSVGIDKNPFVSVANACAFDLSKPERTAIDRILEAETLVLARPDPDNPFSYKVTKILRGENSDHDVPFLVHSLNRSLLKLNPDDAVLFGQMDGENWMQIAYVDADFRDVLHTTLDHAKIWGEGYPASRFAVFEAMQTSANPKLRDLAIAELDKAPYDMLRGLDLQFTTQDLLADLWTPTGYAYQPIRTLLLGLSDDDRARKEIYGYFARTQHWDWANNIGAFSAALIELEGVEGVRYLDRILASNPKQPLDKLQGLISALAVQRSGSETDIRHAIDQLLANMVDARVETAPLVAQQFSIFSDWSQQDLLAQLVRDKKLVTTADLIVVSVYVAQAKSATRPKVEDPTKG